MSKRCFKCDEEKDLSEFYKHRQMRDGHLNNCKSCTKKDSNKYRYENLEKVLKYDRERGALEHRREKVKIYSKTFAGKVAGAKAKKEYIKCNPIRRSAHIIVGNAIRDGLLIKRSCEMCESSQRVHAHHDDYARPLDVRWLCPKCHKDWHKNNIALNGD